MAQIEVTHFNDPGCPWGYSVSPALGVLRWRYGSQLHWRLVTVGLAENPDRYLNRGYTPARAAQGYLRYRARFGMPFATAPRPQVPGTARACRAIVATRLIAPELEDQVFRALQFGWFTSTLVLDREPDIAQALSQFPGLKALDIQALVGMLDDPRVDEAYESDRAETRTAKDSPTEFQGKSANSDGLVRYTAPSLIFSANGKRLEGGGFQPVEVYDALIANLDQSLRRESPPQTPEPVLERFVDGLSTQEIAAIMAAHNEPPDRDGTERTLIELAGAGQARRVPVGNDALWLPS